MTNGEIILRESIKLMEKGELKGIKFGEEIMPEPIHTYAKWKELGRQVKKGEKSKIKFCIWKYVSKKNKDGENDDKMFMKLSSFFKYEQTEPIKNQ